MNRYRPLLHVLLHLSPFIAFHVFIVDCDKVKEKKPYNALKKNLLLKQYVQ